MSHPSGHFSGDYISSIKGCCPLKFLHTLEIAQGYIAHTTTGMGVPLPKKIICKNLKFGLKLSVCASNFVVSGSSLTKLFQTTCCDGGVIMYVPFLEGQHPKIWAKKLPNFGAISENFRL